MYDPRRESAAMRQGMLVAEDALNESASLGAVYRYVHARLTERAQRRRDFPVLPLHSPRPTEPISFAVLAILDELRDLFGTPRHLAPVEPPVPPQAAPRPVPAPNANELTVASFNAFAFSLKAPPGGFVADQVRLLARRMAEISQPPAADQVRLLARRMAEISRPPTMPKPAEPAPQPRMIVETWAPRSLAQPPQKKHERKAQVDASTKRIYDTVIALVMANEDVTTARIVSASAHNQRPLSEKTVRDRFRMWGPTPKAGLANFVAEVKRQINSR